MSRSDRARIADMVEVCREVAEVVAQRQAGGASGLVLLRAVERLREILGEAATRVWPESRAEYPDVAWRGLTSLRIVWHTSTTAQIRT